MKTATWGLKTIACVILASFALSACAGSDDSSVSEPPVPQPGPVNPTPPDIGNGQLPAPVVALIDKRYSGAPDLKTAATGFATAMATQWKAAESTGSYDEKLSSASAHAQLCLSARAERLGTPVTEADLVEFLGALASTRELFSMMRKSDALQSGHPLILSVSEANACVKAGGL